MDKPFTKELIWTNYLLIGGFALIIIAGSLYYGASTLFWTKSLGFLAILALVLLVKLKRIKARGKDLDERMKFITYRAVYIGFYFFLGAILWYYTKEMTIDGQLSTRTYVELLAGLTGYVGSYLILRKRI